MQWLLSRLTLIELTLIVTKLILLMACNGHVKNKGVQKMKKHKSLRDLLIQYNCCDQFRNLNIEVDYDIRLVLPKMHHIISHWIY